MAGIQAIPGEFTVRKLWVVDRNVLLDHLLRLDATTRRSRFGAEVNDRFLVAYAQRAFSINVVAYGCFVDGTLRGTGELRFLFDTWPIAAEAAFAVEAPFQDHGLGRTLMGQVIATARNRAVEVLHMICLAENGRMRHLVDAFHEDLSAAPGATVATLAAAPAFTDGMDDGSGFVRAALRM